MKNKFNVNKILIITIVILAIIVGTLLYVLISGNISKNNKSNNENLNSTNTSNEVNSDDNKEENGENKEDVDKIEQTTENVTGSKVEQKAEENQEIAKKENTTENKSENKAETKTENLSESKTQTKQEEKQKETAQTNNTLVQSNINYTAPNNKIIVIDPGHQIKGNSAQEPIGPGATETKAKVTGGATGVATKQTEYALNLKVALLLQQKLQEKGYTVIMTRTTNEVNISNKERAEIANNANAAAFIRIHANSLNDQSVKGILTMCQTANNPYNGYLAEKSYSLSKLVLDNVIKTTGGVNKGVTRTDTMSGINWCTVPTTIIEMGFLSNPEEDSLLATDSYQEKIVDGIVQGIEEFLR